MTSPSRFRSLRLPLVALCALAGASATLALPHAQAADTAKPTPKASASMKFTLTPVTEGVSKQVGYYIPQRLTLATAKPAGIAKEPAYIGTPMYGTLHFGANAQNGVLVALDVAADGSKAVLYADTDRKGDLTTQAVTLERNARKMKGPAGEFENVMYTGAVKLMAGSASGSHAPLSLTLYAFGAEAAKVRKIPAGTMFYYRDYAQSGKIALGAKTYPVMLLNDTSSGRYDVMAHGEKEMPPVSLLIDRDGDGKFDASYERFDAGKPFSIGGTTYEIAKITPDGSEVTLTKSTQKVEEVPIPANLSAGQPALAFARPVIGGKKINFPGDYKGKVVLLDFWATWCPPCREEIPGLVKTYQKYHARGFEVLGISLDQAGQEQKVADFLKANNMTWDQVYDGKYWAADVAKMYSIQSIPHAFLVDGTTGKIIVEGDTLRGDALDAQISKALPTVKVSRR